MFFIIAIVADIGVPVRIVIDATNRKNDILEMFLGTIQGFLFLALARDSAPGGRDGIDGARDAKIVERDIALLHTRVAPVQSEFVPGEI